MVRANNMTVAAMGANTISSREGTGRCGQAVKADGHESAQNGKDEMHEIYDRHCRFVDEGHNVKRR